MTAIKLDDNNCLRLIGELNINNLTKFYRQVLKLIDQQAVLSIDLREADIQNSAFLAAMTAWLRHAKKCHHQLTFKNVPHSLIEMASLSHLDDLLSITNNDGD